MSYRTKTTQQLIEAYAYEATRDNIHDRLRTQRAIRRELAIRFEATLNLLEDEQTTKNPLGTFRYLLGE